MCRTRSARSTRSATIVEKAHARGIPVLVDGAQAVAHMPVDVQALGADFYAFSGHKLFGPTGIGVLWGRLPLLEAMPPYQGGGDMISAVTFEKTTYNVVPNKFEAGTPNIAGSVGLGRGDRLSQRASISRPCRRTKTSCSRYGTKALSAVPGVRIVGTAAHKASVLSFVMEDVHPHDIGTILDQQGVAIRTGPPLHAAADGAAVRSGDGPRLAGAIQYEGRDRRARRRPRQGAGDILASCGRPWT